MYRRIVATLAVALAAAAAPVAADPPDSARLKGGCAVTSVQDPNAPDTWVGEVEAYGLAYSLWYEHAPVTVQRLRCEIHVNGEPVYAIEAAGTGPVVVIPPTPVSYPAGIEDIVYMCDTVELVDAHGHETGWTHCYGDPGWELIPRDVRDAFEYYVKPHTCPAGLGCTPEETLDRAFDTLYGIIDPTVCAALSAQPQDHGRVRIEEGGDVYVDGFLWWDCPPYES